jgi:phosphoketolase
VPDILSREELDAMNALWRAAKYFSVGQIYLLDNPLLRDLKIRAGRAADHGMDLEVHRSMRYARSGL